MKFLPPVKNNSWFRWMAVYGLLLWLLLLLHRFLLLDEPFNLLIALRFALLALVISGLVHLFGWLGARLLWIFSTAGLIFGLLFMFNYTYREMSGWEDLAGFLSFGIFTLGGFALGLAAEGVYLLIKHQRND
jgi:energy-coupling factor transporter transmembrane protein EcfT